MRVKRGFVSRRRHKKYQKLAKGFRNRRRNVFTFTKDAVERSMVFAYRDRRRKKRDFRRLWITRINAGARLSGLSYSKFMRGIALSKIDLDRKQLAELAAREPAVFAELAERARAALA